MPQSKTYLKKEKWPLKAYNNMDFLNSPAARTIRVLTEMIEPAERLRKHRIRNTVVFFGSARILSHKKASAQFKKIKKKSGAEYDRAHRNLQMSRFYEEAAILSEKLTHWFNHPEYKHHNFKVCSGGGPGIMEAVNLGSHRANGESMGLNISLPMEQDPNPYQTKDISFDFHYFFIRKFWFFYLSKAMIVFPGGFGTFDELFELLTLVQTGKTTKYMPIFLYGKDFWEEVVNFSVMEKWGLISPKDQKLFRIVDDVDTAFELVKKELERHYLRGQPKDLDKRVF